MRNFFRFLDSVLDRIFAILGFLFFAQGPEFIQQYIQRLGGHIDELVVQINKIKEMAEFSGKSIQQYIEKFKSSSDTDFAGQGSFMQDILERHQSFQQVLTQLSEKNPFLKPYYFVKNLDMQVARETFNSFVPGISFTLEGIIYGIIGIFFGVALYKMIKEIIKFPFVLISLPFRRKPKPKPVAEPVVIVQKPVHPDHNPDSNPER